MKLLLLEAGYGRTFKFDYPFFNVDKTPKVLVLGRWRHPNTRNVLVCGINLNYLTDEEIEALRKNLGTILAQPNLKQRYRTGAELLPDIFKTAYRTYKNDAVINVTKDTLRKWPSAQAAEKEARRKRWQEMSPEERNEYIRQARTSTQRREVSPETQPEAPKPPPEEPRYE